MCCCWLDRIVADWEVCCCWRRWVLLLTKECVVTVWGLLLLTEESAVADRGECCVLLLTEDAMADWGVLLLTEEGCCWLRRALLRTVDCAVADWGQCCCWLRRVLLLTEESAVADWGECCCWLRTVLLLNEESAVADWGECCCWLRSVFQDTGSMRRVWRSGLQTCATDSSMRKPWTGSGRMTSSLCDPSSTSSSTRWPKMSRLGQCSFFLGGLGCFCLS